MAGEVVGIIDAGGRGAALARAYERSPHVERIVVIPGNNLQFRDDVGWEDVQRLREAGY
jgi:phosphoribosylamine-glycine ligase